VQVLRQSNKILHAEAYKQKDVRMRKLSKVDSEPLL